MSQPIGACAILFNPSGQVLVGKRKNSFMAGYYGLPGGHIELNERLLACIQREVTEETGLVINNFQQVGVIRENVGEIDFIHFVFAVTNVNQVPILGEPEKCEGWVWADPAQLTGQIVPAHEIAIKMYQDKINLVDVVG